MRLSNGKRKNAKFAVFLRMRPSKKGWIREYINLRSQRSFKHDVVQSVLPENSTLDHDQKMYRLMQPSGLMYGHPVRTTGNFPLQISHWDDRDKMKLILLDSLINQSLLVRANGISDQNELQECVVESINSILNFYQESSFANVRIPSSMKKKDQNLRLESIIDQRLQVRISWKKNFWAGFFENSLLFLDVYSYGLWCRNEGKLPSEIELKATQERIRLSILQIIAAAAHANKIIEDEEKRLFHFFLKSANLSKDLELQAKKYLQNTPHLDDMSQDDEAPWIVRKYLLELAILTVWADKRLEASEKTFIQELAKRLSLDHSELQRSFIAIESFVITNWEQVHFLQSRHNLFMIKDRFSKRLAFVLNKNKNAVVQEIRESKELMQLLRKMTREKLSEKEKEMVRMQLLDILKTLPTFVIIALPGTFITLPLLIKLLPASAFPSAFSEGD